MSVSVDGNPASEPFDKDRWWDERSSVTKTLIGVGGGGLYLGLTIGGSALVGSLVGVGASAGIVWNLSLHAAFLTTGVIINQLIPRISKITALVASFFGGALGLMAYSDIGFSAATITSAKLMSATVGLLVGGAIFIGAAILVVQYVARLRAKPALNSVEAS